MLEALVRVLVWLSLGEILMRVGALPAPGPVIGLVLLYCDLTWRGELPEALGTLSDRLLGLLGLLFVPAGVGVVAHADVLRAEFVPIAAAVVGGTIITILATATAARVIGAMARRRSRRGPGMSRGGADLRA